jgi:tetratricopeptide (TPR) repeat protein
MSVMFKETAILIFTFLIFSSCDFTNASEYYNRAIDLEKQEKHKEAILSLDRAIVKEPKFRPALLNRGNYKTEIGDFQGAIDDFNLLLVFDQDNTAALFNIGNSFSLLKEHKQSIDYYSKALNTKGALRTIPISNGGYLDMITNSDFKNFDSDMTYQMYDCLIYFERGMEYLYAKKYDKAISDITKSLKANNAEKDCYFLLGKAYLGKKDSINACQNFIESAQLGDQEARDMLKKYCIKKN